MDGSNAEQLAASMRWEQEAQRIKIVTKSFAGEELINAGLNARPLNENNVVILWYAATRALCDGMPVVPIYAQNNVNRFWNAVSTYLRREGWTQIKLSELEQARPWWTGPVLDEIAEMDPAVRGTIDEILGLEGKK
jgi:hypothetical protein